MLTLLIFRQSVRYLQTSDICYRRVRKPAASTNIIANWPSDFVLYIDSLEFVNRKKERKKNTLKARLFCRIHATLERITVFLFDFVTFTTWYLSKPFSFFLSSCLLFALS